MKFSPKETPLPTTRKEQLRDVVKYRFTDIAFVSIYMLCFLLPGVVWLIFWTYFIGEGIGGIYDVIIQYGVLIPFLMLFGLGVAGALYFWKRLAYNEGSSVHSDFFIGIRKNFKQFLLMYFLLGIGFLLLHVNEFLLFSNTVMSQELRYILLGVNYFFFFLILVIFFFAQTQSIIYQGSLWQFMKNALTFVIAKFFKNLLAFLIILWPFIIFEFLDLFFAIEIVSIVQWIMIAICGIFYFGFSSLYFTLYSLDIFDLSINKKYYPEIIRKGLAHEDSSKNNNIQ